MTENAEHARSSHGKTHTTAQATAEAHAPQAMLSLLPISILTDSYKTTHFMSYPDSRKMVAYAEFRNGFDKDQEDTRLVCFGIRYLLENFVARQWTQQDIDKAAEFFSAGYFPVILEALPEGTCVHAHCPVFQITAEDEFAPLCTFLETLLTMLWYPTTVATLSRRARDCIEAAFEKTVDEGRNSPLLGSRLHDFGFRGCTCVEQSVLGGVAHLLNFGGSDTLSAAYYAQFELNNGQPVAMSIPATEHSVMTAWHTERQALQHMIEQFGTGLLACVMDSYDYVKALAEHLPAVAQQQIGQGGFLILRPDSGDPVTMVLLALQAAEKVFGADTNSKGYKVPRSCGVIQGDGININVLEDILQAVMSHGYSAQIKTNITGVHFRCYQGVKSGCAGANSEMYAFKCTPNSSVTPKAVAFGMGGGLLQKVNRDTMSFATKLSHIVYADGSAADLMKLPKSDAAKFSLPGIMAVKRVDGVPTAFPADGGHVSPNENLLQVMWNKGPVKVDWKLFSDLRQQVDQQWRALPKSADVLSKPLKDKIAAVMQRLRAETS